MTCRTCGAPVRPERTPAGRRVDLDPEPDPAGVLVLVHPWLAPPDEVRVVQPPAYADLGTEPRYTVHDCRRTP